MGNSSYKTKEAVPESVLTAGERPPLVNIIALGADGAGKTSILLRFREGQFVANPPQDICYTKFQCQIGSTRVDLRVGDQLRYTSMSWSCYVAADVILVVYDVSKPESIDFLSRFEKNGRLQSVSERAAFIVVGNKTDLAPAINTAEAQRIANESGYDHVLCSAKDGTNIEELLKLCYKRGLQAQAYKMEDYWEPC